jgi:hypothetical protein
MKFCEMVFAYSHKRYDAFGCSMQRSNKDMNARDFVASEVETGTIFWDHLFTSRRWRLLFAITLGTSVVPVEDEFPYINLRSFLISRFGCKNTIVNVFQIIDIRSITDLSNCEDLRPFIAITVFLKAGHLSS